MVRISAVAKDLFTTTNVRETLISMAPRMKTLVVVPAVYSLVEQGLRRIQRRSQ